MNPKIWGPSAWLFLHSITLAYPNNPSYDDMNNYRQFFESIKYVLPCDSCKEHFKENLQKYPLTDRILESKDLLCKWLIDIHNSVNIRTNKKVLTYEQVFDIYTDIYDENKKNHNLLFLFLSFMLLSVSLLILYKNITKL
jgi:hypothetical protein